MMFLVAAALLSAQASDGPAAFNKTVGQWQIAGDRDVKLCVMTAVQQGATSLTVLSFPQAASLTFSLKNDAWRSLADDEKGRLSAHFIAGGEVTDVWDLAIVSYNNKERGPIINFTIDRAKNDGASFIQQFSGAQSISFHRDKVPVARFELKQSAKAIATLLSCREYLRASPDFDPFDR